MFPFDQLLIEMLWCFSLLKQWVCSWQQIFLITTEIKEQIIGKHFAFPLTVYEEKCE